MRELIAALAVAASVPGAGASPATPTRSVAQAPRATPPSLTPGALATELRESNRRRFEELAELQREQARLEQLVAQIAIARRELARESALLDEKLAKVEQRAADRPAPEEPPSSAERPPDGGDGQPEAPAEAQVLALAKTLKGMKPDQAAALVGRIEKSLAVAVLTKLRPADAAGVLGRMPSGTAAELFTLMARNGASPR